MISSSSWRKFNRTSSLSSNNFITHLQAYPSMRIRARCIQTDTQGLHHHSMISKSPERKALFNKILIANRGEVACRVIKTARKLGVKTVAIYSEIDRYSRHVKLADEAYLVGPAPSTQSYLNMEKIVQLCIRSGAQAVHPGWGFLSERAEFAEKLKAAGITFIGPPSSAIISMGSKSESKEIMTNANVPCVPGYHGQNQDPSFLKEEARKIGYPVLIKAIKGGGGKGMKIVFQESEFETQLESAQREGQQSFGDGTVLLEKYLLNPRHVEVQVFGDHLGNYVHLYERDCSVQRRHQKIIEEAPAPGLSSELRAELGAKAVAAAKAVGYVGAGTVEFILDSDGKFYYMEMNTRLQVEHPITEMITRQDLVQWQLEIASGNQIPLKQNEIPCDGHAFEARIYAENPRRNFLPDVGKLLHLSTPKENESVRVETGVDVGDEISVYYDPMIAKLVVHSPKDRTTALRLLNEKLHEYEIVGPSTNIEFLKSLSVHPAFMKGEVETGFIEKHRSDLFPKLSTSVCKTDLIKTGLFLASNEIERKKSSSSSPWDNLYGWRMCGGGSRQVYEFSTVPEERFESDSVKPTRVEVEVYSGEPDFSLTIQDGVHQGEKIKAQVRLFPSSDLHPNARRFETTIEEKVITSTHVLKTNHPTSNSSIHHHLFSNEGITQFISPWPKWFESIQGIDPTQEGKLGKVRALMPSKVIKVMIKKGDEVKKGDELIILEAMKTEVVLKSPRDGIVKEIKAKLNGMVSEGEDLVIFEN
ncbi:carbamoyl-phosphate synthase L chain, ATP binding domain-containing protein [Melampsora americana]|nr:carbamoyl-phosphate synthase L chain, ATP binding domain-containing protein [Melampsora americana]